MKWILRIIVVLIFLFVLIRYYYPGLLFYIYEKDLNNKAIISWLIKKNPEVFKCGKNFSLSQSWLGNNAYKNDEGVYTKIHLMSCLYGSTFWVNKETHQVECHISYCDNNEGKKICCNEGAEKLCGYKQN